LATELATVSGLYLSIVFKRPFLQKSLAPPELHNVSVH